MRTAALSSGWISSPLLRHVGIVALLVALAFTLERVYPREIRGLAHKWLDGLTPQGSKQLEDFTTVKASPQERERLKDQLAVIRARAKHHLEVAVYFFSNYYMSLLVTFVSGAIAAVSLFFIVRVGWPAANQYVITLFVTATALATAYGAFPGVFRQADNVSENKTLYLRYVALQNEILSYSATGRNNAAKSIPVSEFIIYLDGELNRINNLAIGFDASKLPAFRFDTK